MNGLLKWCGLSGLVLATTTLADGTPTQLASLEPDHRIEAAAPPSPWKTLNPRKLRLRSAAALIVDASGREVYSKQANEPLPIASITKLMTGMVILDSDLSMDEKITIGKEDRDLIQLTGSRLEYGATLSRREMLQLALMSSENRAANALGRSWPGGMKAFVAQMNRKARQLGMNNSRFMDPAGLDPGNIASAHDLAKMVTAALEYDFIRKATTTTSVSVRPYRKRGKLRYGNTNRLLKNSNWEIGLSKTGYLNEAGRCLAMQADIAEQPLVIVLLNSYGKLTPFGDSNRIRKWITTGLDG